MLYATVRNRKIHVKRPDTVIQNGVQVDWLNLDMDDEWKSMESIVCVFVLHYTEESTSTQESTTTTTIVEKEVQKEMLHTFGEPVMVPWECLEHTGMLSVNCTGYVNNSAGEAVQVMTTAYPDSYWEVVQNGPTSGEKTLEPTPTLYDQIVAAAGAASTAAQEAIDAKNELLQDKESGVFDGKDGKSTTVTVGSTSTGAPGSSARVFASGDSENLVLDFLIPRGQQGLQGEPGPRGYPGIGHPGDPGKDGETPYIGQNGNWFIGLSDTGVQAQGEDGKTPYIGENENWFIGDTDTGKPSRGQPGRDAEVPEVLPNPYPLYLDIGGATAEYDGSEAIMLKYTPPIDTSGTTMLKMLQEHNESEEAHPDIRNSIPDWAKAPEKPTYTAAEVGADAAGAAEAAVAAHDSSETAHQDIRDAIPTVPAALPNPNKLTFTGAVSAEYDGSSAVKVNIPAGGGGGGTDLSLGISGASAGQIAKITTVDAEGKPTAWEAAEPASGGSREPELLYSETVENVSSLEHEIDFNGYQNFTIVVGAERADSVISLREGALSFNGREYMFAYYTTQADAGSSGNEADVTVHTLTRIGPDHFKVDYYRRVNAGTPFDPLLQATSSIHAISRTAYLRGRLDTTFSKISIRLSGTTPKLSVEVYGF